MGDQSSRGFLGGNGVDDDVASDILEPLPDVWMRVNAVSFERKGPNETGQLLNVFFRPVKFRNWITDSRHDEPKPSKPRMCTCPRNV